MDANKIETSDRFSTKSLIEFSLQSMDISIRLSLNLEL